jgi:hypothetical protein
VASALGRPVAAVALSLPAGRAPGAWMLLSPTGRSSEPPAAPLPVRVDLVDALEAVVRAGCRLVLAPEGDVGALCQRWPATATAPPASTRPDHADPAHPGGEVLEVPPAFRAALEAPDTCDADRRPPEPPGRSASAG